MNIWLVMWAAAAGAEAVLYSLAVKPLSGSRWARWLVAAAVAGAVVAVDTMLLFQVGTVWLVPMLLLPYRLVNVARFGRHRLHVNRLRDVTIRAHGWLVAAQVVLAASSWLLHAQSLTNLLGILGGVQLFVVLVLLRSSTQTWENAKPKQLDQHYTDRELPSVSVLIPARDETEALETCLSSLVANDYPKLEILVLDDCSLNRRTPEIIRGYAHDGVRFVQGKVAPDSWIAKNFAYDQLAGEASGDVLLFCGVDTTFEPRTIRALVETLLARKKEMLSVLPTRPSGSPTLSLLQSMRYYWELCLPRRMFKRPPVLSSCWLIRKTSLESYGGFAAVSQSTSPEAHFARKAVVSDSYTFIRSHGDLQVHSLKTVAEQFETTVRLRYPQLHRRLELVAAASLFELTFFVSPFVGLVLSLALPHGAAFFAIWFACILTVEVMYYLIAVQTRLQSAWMAFLVAPVAFLFDIFMLHLSMWRYEFGEVNWKGRNVCIPVMRVEPSLPKLPE